MSQQTNRVETKPSQTAKQVCWLRALAYAEMGPPVANDYLASKLLSPKSRERVKSAEKRALILTDEVELCNLSYLTARTRHLDRLFQEALADDTRQIVLLGAGFDSRSYRFRTSTDDVAIYEVDAPTTQGAKRKYLKLAEIEAPDYLRYVSINFNVESLLDVLTAAGYDPRLKTFFLWEGVTYYISAEAIDTTLEFIRTQSGVGSKVAFDYMYAHTIAGDFRDVGAEVAVKGVAAIDEPFISGIEAGTVGEFLAERGFTLVEHYLPEAFHDAYLDERFSPMYGFMLNAVALT